MTKTGRSRHEWRLAAVLALLANLANGRAMAVEPHRAAPRSDTVRPTAPLGTIEPQRAAARADTVGPRAPLAPGRRMPLPSSGRSRPEPPPSIAAALVRSRHLLLDVRPFDFMEWKQELRGAFVSGPDADLWIATECRRCALVMAGQLPEDSLLSVIDTGVTLAPSLAFDDSLLDLCERIGRQPPAMQRERDLAVEKQRMLVAPPPPPASGDEPRLGEYVYVDELPEAIRKVDPSYPDAARPSKVEGTVMLQVLVGKDGRVRDVRVVKSIALLDTAAIEAARQWIFKPALSRGQPVAVWVGIPMRFTPN